MKAPAYTWELGQTVGYIAPIAAPEGHARRRFADHRGNYILAVTNDSVNWAYRIVPAYTDERREGSSVFMTSVNPRSLAAEGATVRGLTYAVTRLQSNLRLPIEWAKRQAKKDLESGADLEVTHTIHAAKLLSVISYPSIFDGDVVTYIGSVARPAHTLEDLHRVVLKAQEAALAYWGFSCSRLEVQFFTDGNVMGLAYNPGSGKSSGKRLISLNARLLQAFTLDTIWRTVIHELCHHARNERFAINYDDQHDSHFCDMLSKADPLAQDKRGCAFFTEMADSSLAAGIRQRKAGPIPPVYDPELGTVYLNRLKSGAFRIGWVPTEKAVARWKSVIIPLTSSAIEDIVKNFSPAQWGSVTVTTENYPYQVKPESLADLIQTLVKSYPLQMLSLITYLNTLAAA